MKKLVLSCIILLTYNFAYAVCPTPSSSPQISRGDINTVQFIWNLNSASAWHQQAQEPISEKIESFFDFVSNQTNSNQFFLLKKQQAVFAKAFGNNSQVVKQFQAIIDKRIGKIEPSSCLDQLLLSNQFSYTTIDAKTEFAALVFQKGDQLRIHGAWRTNEEAAGPRINLTEAQKTALRQQGWTFLFNLHNHPFGFDNEYGDIAGTVIGSDADFDTFNLQMKNQQLQFGRITNGFDTAIYHKTDVQNYLKI